MAFKDITIKNIGSLYLYLIQTTDIFIYTYFWGEYYRKSL